MKKSVLIVLVALILPVGILSPAIVFASQRNSMMQTFAKNNNMNGTSGYSNTNGSNWEGHAGQMHGDNWQNHMSQNMTQHHEQVSSSCH